MKFRNTTKAQKTLAGLLKEAAKESIKGDSGVIGERIGKTAETVLSYMKGDVRNLNTGSVILTELRKCIDKRNNKVERLVA